MKNSRNIDDLHPLVAQMCRDFVAKCADLGYSILITSTYRDLESQAAIYAQGRTKPGKKVTNAKPGTSYHNWKVAFDFVPIVNGKAQWNDVEIFNMCGKIGKECGLEWAGDWTKFKELCHMQYTAGLTIKDFQAGKTIDNI
jgi:peptidoglycan L-alanyl-D-glutamate endopeptidase CwlK